MKTLLYCVLPLFLLLYCSSPNSGTSSDVATGSITGMVVCDTDTLKKEVVVELYKSDTLPGGLKKAAQAAVVPLKRDTTVKLGYAFDSLAAGVYSMRVLQDGLAIGRKEGVSLDKGQHLKVNITVVVIIQQTFIVSVDNSQHITINNFTVNNATVVPDTSGKYKASFAKMDTVPASIEYLQNGKTVTAYVLLVLKGDGSYRIVPVGSVAPITIIISPPNTGNHAPIFTSTPADMGDAAAVGASYLDTVHATDPDGDTVLFSFIDSAAGMTVGLTSGIIAWKPARGDTGAHTVRLRASDNRGGLDTLMWTILVRDTSTGLNKGLVAYYPFNGNAKDESGHGNDGRVFGAMLVTDRFGNAQKAYSFNGTSDYIDIGDTLFSSQPTAVTVSAWAKNSRNGLDQPIFYHGRNGEINLGIYSDSLVFDIDNQNNQWVQVKQPWHYSQWHHVVGIYTKDNKLEMYIDGIKKGEIAVTGTLYSPSCVCRIGRYGCSFGLQRYFNGLIDDIRIYNRALSPAEIDSLYHEGGWKENPNSAPAFTSQPADMRDTVMVGASYRDTVHATDPDGDTVLFSFIDSATGMTVGMTSGAITWTPAIADTGSRTVRVCATDGMGGNDSLAWTITVKRPANLPPKFTSTSGEMTSQATAGSLYVEKVRATDPDGDTVLFSFIDSAAGMTVGMTSGAITWTPAIADTGGHTIRVRASDGKGGTDSLAWTITVKRPANLPPKFTSTTGNMTAQVTARALYSDTVHATDPDHDPLSFAFIDSVAGMKLKDSIITWTPAEADSGNHPISVAALDNKGGRDTLPWLILVASLGPHTIARPAAPSGPQNGTPGTKYGFVTTLYQCSHHDSLQYRFSWGNGASGEWRKSFQDSVAWPEYGRYKVRVQARCAIDTAIVSDTSQVFLVGILNGPDGTLFDDCDGDPAMVTGRWGDGWWVYDDSNSTCAGRSAVYNNANQKIHTWPNSNEFRLTPGEGNPFGSGGACAKIIYQLDTRSSCNDSLGKPINWVGTGICIGQGCSLKDLSGISSISFWAKGAVPVNMLFMVGTTDVKDGEQYQCVVSINTFWQKYTVPLSSLSQPRWASLKVPLDVSKANKINFEFNSVSPNPRNNTFWVDDIYFQGYSWKP